MSLFLLPELASLGVPVSVSYPQVLVSLFLLLAEPSECSLAELVVYEVELASLGVPVSVTP